MWTAEDEAKYEAALVRFYHGSRISGAGILVSDCYVLTCAHVLIRGSDPPETVSLDFPFKANGQKLKGVVEYWEPDRDLAGIKLLDPLPQEAEPLPLKPSHNYINNNFRVYGFPDQQPVGGWALGKIIGGATEDLVQIQGETDQGYGIEPGFSGAPVWSVEFGGVIGLARLRDKNRPGAKIAYLTPYRQMIDGLKAGEAVSLLAVLESNDTVAAESLEGAYRVCRPEGSIDFIPGDLSGRVKALARMRDQAGYSALVRFAVCLTLAEFPVPLDVSQQLRKWLRQRDVDIAAVATAIAPQIAVEQTRSATTASPHLLIWLNAVRNADTYPVGALFIPDRAQYDPTVPKGFEPIPAIAQYEDTPIRLSRLPDVIRDCLADCTNLCPNLDITTLTIELFLPITLLHQALEWEAAFEVSELVFLEPEPIATRYSFVLRSSERLLKEYERAQCLAFWKNKWQDLETTCQTQSCETLLLVSDETNLQQLQMALKAPDKAGLKLLNCPTQVQAGKPLRVLLGSGSPTAIWIREELSQIDCTAELATLLDCCLEALPASVQQARRDAFPLAKDAHIGHHLSLVWEDPNLVPPVTDNLAS